MSAGRTVSRQDGWPGAEAANRPREAVELFRKSRRLYPMIWRLRTASSAAIMGDN